MDEKETEKKFPIHEENKMISHEELKELSSTKIKELEEKHVRLAADFENFKKRSQKEQIMIREFSSAEIVLKMLPILDEFEIAMQFSGDDGEFKNGMNMIFQKLKNMLRNEGLEEMVCDFFDPNLHDAIKTEKGEKGKIIGLVQKGYMFRGKVLRHAKVIVGENDE